jgi:HD-like signal output (HDOD) protein
MAIDLFDFYKRCLLPLTPHPAVTKILKYVMTGGETTDDFAEILHFDPELQHWARTTVLRMGKGAKRIEQVITILGQDRIRDLTIGRYIERAFVKPENTLLAKAQKESTPDEEKKDPAAGASEKAVETAPPQEEAKEKLSPEEAEKLAAAKEIIPDIAAYRNYLEFACRAEHVATSIRNSYPGQAFSGGVLFDYVRYFLESIPAVAELKDERIRNVHKYVTNIFEDGLRSGIAANALMKKIIIRHQKTIFVAALCHNIGKGLLMAYDPMVFEKAFMKSTGAESGRRMDSTEAEAEEFQFDHAQAGSLFFRRLSFFEDIEMSVDFHHHPHLLRFSNPNLFALACALRLSGRLVKTYQKYRVRNPNIEDLPDGKIKTSEDYQFLKLNDRDWNEIKAEYVQKLLRAGL